MSQRGRGAPRPHAPLPSRREEPVDSAGRRPPSERQGRGRGGGTGLPAAGTVPMSHVLARGSARPGRHTASPGLLGTGRRDRGHRLFLVNCHRGRTAPRDGRGREDQPEMGQAGRASTAAREGRGQRRGQRGGRAGPRNGPRLRLRGSSPADPPVPSTPARVCVLLRASGKEADSAMVTHGGTRSPLRVTVMAGRAPRAGTRLGCRAAGSAAFTPSRQTARKDVCRLRNFPGRRSAALCTVWLLTVPGPTLQCVPHQMHIYERERERDRHG